MPQLQDLFGWLPGMFRLLPGMFRLLLGRFGLLPGRFVHNNIFIHFSCSLKGRAHFFIFNFKKGNYDL